jgi:signal transduction histidine kinase
MLIKLRRSWDGIVGISWSIKPEVFAHLPTASFNVVNDVLYDAVSNSVRHGGAMKIDIIFDFDSRGLILIVKDDGSGINHDFTPGSGLRKIAEVGGTYQLTSEVEQGAQLIIHFPLKVLDAISSNQPSTMQGKK